MIVVTNNLIHGRNGGWYRFWRYLLPLGEVGSVVPVFYRRAYTQTSYQRSVFDMRKLLLSLLASIFLLLTACSGGGSSGGGGGGSNGGDSGGGPGVTLAPFTNASLIITPSGSNFTITLENYESLTTDIGNISINAIGEGNNGGHLLLSQSAIRESEGEFVISISGPEGEYAITVTIAYTNGSIVSDFPIVFVNEQNREDYENDGIYLGPDYDGDLQADGLDGDDDNDGIADGSDMCAMGETGWESNRSNDTDTDGCRDRDEDTSLVGVTDLDKVASPGQVVLTWTNPDVAIGHIDISWQDQDGGNSDSVEKRGDVMSGMSSNHTIPGLANGETYTFTVVVHYANGGESVVTTIDVLVDGDEDGDGVLNMNEVDGCETKPDCDDDGHNDAVDIDADGDGLIEISTAAELDAVRYQLDGTGWKLSATATVDETGCGNGTDSGDITACHGYELANNISLARYIQETYPGNGWLPIGYDTSLADSHFCDDSTTSSFSVIFEGNHFVISGLSIDRPEENCIGLFAYLGSGGEVRRLGIEAERIRGSKNVGTLAAQSHGVISFSHAIVNSLVGRRNIGGLVGTVGNVDSEVESGKTTIHSSYAIINSLSGDTTVGGLGGSIPHSKITASYAIFNELHSKHHAGGLLGGSWKSDVIASYAIFNSLATSSPDNESIGGGLIGLTVDGTLISSYVIANSLAGAYYVGGFIGNATGSTFIDSSYGVFGSLTSDSEIPSQGLVGHDKDSPSIGVTDSYWNSETTNLKSGTYGEPKLGSALTGPMDYGGIDSIYGSWDNGTGLRDNRQSVNDITIYCDSDGSGTIEPSERTDDNRIWDFGTADEYPAIRCTPNNPPAAQRAWWSLNNQGEPMLNEDRLNGLLRRVFSSGE